MKKNIGIITFLALGILWVSAQSAPPTVANSHSFSLKVSTTAESFHLGKAVHLEISLTNISDHKIYVRRTNGNIGAADFDVFAQDENGNSAPESPYYRALKGRLPRDSSEPKVSVRGDFQVIGIEPGQSIESSIDLGKVFDLSHTGNFNVWVERNDSASKNRVKSNAISVAINR